ncbi:MAG: hypothetical protein A4E32_01400 [Methanomassiliicoccales archaeon PtaU1.Bin124]|nr:MAG: hypothetical protein A4E32_01400 [Methanomassiliicoccales archaeon PtaU1.Bin124]
MEPSMKNVECSDWDEPEDYQCEIAYRARNLENLAPPKPVFKAGQNDGVDIIGRIEKVPKVIKNRSTPDPFYFAKRRTPVPNMAIRELQF